MFNIALHHKYIRDCRINKLKLIYLVWSWTIHQFLFIQLTLIFKTEKSIYVCMRTCIIKLNIKAKYIFVSINNLILSINVHLINNLIKGLAFFCGGKC
jgi:hypothetical protein